MSFDILVTNNEPQRRIIIVGHDNDESVVLKNVILDHKFEFTPSVHIVHDIDEAIGLTQQFHPDCVIAYGDKGRELFYRMEQSNMDPARILVCHAPDFETIKDSINRCGVFRIIFKPWSDEEIVSTISTAIEYIDISRSNSYLVAKAEARNRYLIGLKEMLENKGREQQLDISTSAFTVKGINTEFEIMNDVLSSLHGQESIASIKSSVEKVLNKHMGITHLGINIDVSNKEKGPEICTEGFLALPLFCSGCFLGNMTFQRPGVFLNHEIDFLEKIADVVAMSAEKIVRFYALEKIKKQWESAFDSIDDPIVIIDDRFNIMRANKAFAVSAGENLKDISGKKCYDVLQTDKTNIPCSGCNIKQAFDSGQPVGSEVTAQCAKRFYTTWSYPIKDVDRVVSAVHFYKDVSDQVSYRERLVYSEKLAEIGILAGSVAHEINNPIGGIIALLQIIMSESGEGHPYYKDLTEMERAAQRCKHIVDNLLHFSRTSRDDEVREIEFSSVFKTLEPLVHLQIRHENISLSIDDQSRGVFVKAVFNELVQSILNIMNTSTELISKKGASGFINVSARKEQNGVLIEIVDNGIPVSVGGTGFGSLALFVTEKIVKGYKGHASFEHVDGNNKYRLYFPSSVNTYAEARP